MCEKLAQYSRKGTGHGLVNLQIMVRLPVRTWNCSFLQSVQAGSRAHAASCSMGTGKALAGCTATSCRTVQSPPPPSAEVKMRGVFYFRCPVCLLDMRWDNFTTGVWHTDVSSSRHPLTSRTFPFYFRAFFQITKPQKWDQKYCITQEI